MALMLEGWPELNLLAPSAPVAATTLGGIIASVSFSSTIGLGSVLTAAVVVILAGVFTLRNNLKSFWKELAEERGEQVKVLEADLKGKAQELVDAQLHHTEEMAAFAEEQREVRHQLKNQVAALEGRLKLEEAKHDLSSVIVRLDGLETTLDGRSSLFEQLADAMTSQTVLLTDIRDRL